MQTAQTKVNEKEAREAAAGPIVITKPSGGGGGGGSRLWVLVLSRSHPHFLTAALQLWLQTTLTTFLLVGTDKMDSVKSLNTFFGKLDDQFVTIAKNSKTNSETLTQLYASEQKEEQDRKQAAAKTKARTRRDRLVSKKRKKLDSNKALTAAMDKIFGKDADKKDGGNDLLKTSFSVEVWLRLGLQFSSVAKTLARESERFMTI